MNRKWQTLNDKNKKELSKLVNALTVKEMLNHEKVIIPNYQRGYVWDPPEVRKFLTAIFDDYNKAKNDNEKNAFLGNIITYSSNTQSKSIEVIDGQQRIMTLIIFGVAMIFLLNKSTSEGKEEIKKKIEKQKQEKISEIKRTLFPKNVLSIDHHNKDLINVLNETISIVWDSYEKGESNNYHQVKNKNGDAVLVGSILDTIIKFIKDNTHKKGRDTSELIDLLDYVFVGSYFYNQIIPNEKKAYVYFERLNNIGKKLTDWELIKNYLLFKITNLENLGNVKNKLIDISRLINEHSFAQEVSFILYIYMMFENDNFTKQNFPNKKKNVYDKFKNIIEEINNDKQIDLIRTVINSLTKIVEKFIELKTNNTNNEELKLVYEIVVNNKFAQIKHVIISLYSLFWDEENKERLLEIFKMLLIPQIYLVRILNKRGSTVETRLKTILKKTPIIDEFSSEIKESFKDIFANVREENIKKYIQVMEKEEEKKPGKKLDKFYSLITQTIKLMDKNIDINISNDDNIDNISKIIANFKEMK